MRLQKRHSDTHGGTRESAGADPRGRREGRGWGPFSGGQLTIIVMTFAVLLLFPVGAWALSFSNVAITDPGGVNQAKVNASGQLSAAVKGSVTAKVAFPTTAIVHSDDGFGNPVVYPNDCGSGFCVKLIAPPVGEALVVTSIHVNTTYDPTPGPDQAVRIFRSSDGTCKSNTLELAMEEVNPASVGVTDLRYDLPGGMAIPSGKALCLVNNDSPNLAAAVTAWGYTVASSAVPAIAAVQGAPTGAALLKLKP
jgi:hypothetical protein